MNARKIEELGVHLAAIRFNQEKPRETFTFYTPEYKVEPSRLAKFYELNGFMRIDVDENANPIVIKNESKILKPYNYRNKIISFLKNNIQHEEKRSELEANLIKRKNDVFDSFLLLDEVPYQLHKDTKDAIYIPFSNGVAKITANSMNMLPYTDDHVNLFMEVDSINHSFEVFDLNNRKMGQFEKFLLLAITGRDAEPTGVELRTVGAFFSAIGYLVSNYKDPACSPAIILSDEGANDEVRKGGRGKSLLTRAVSQCRVNKFRGGREHDSGYRHNFADLEPYHDIFILDDVPKNFDYDSLYTQITGDITSQKKQVQAVTIPFADAPKFVITTNWAVRYDREATSTNRRFVEFKFSDFWNLNNQPMDYFGNRLFDDWDEAEWTLFYQFICVCATYYLRCGIQRIDYSKEADNFRAYFDNDVVLETFEMIWANLKSKDSFTAMDFLSGYKTVDPYENKPIFHRNNARKFIDAYIEYHGLNYKYDARSRRWINKDSGPAPIAGTHDDSQLPF